MGPLLHSQLRSRGSKVELAHVKLRQPHTRFPHDVLYLGKAACLVAWGILGDNIIMESKYHRDKGQITYYYYNKVCLNLVAPFFGSNTATLNIKKGTSL